MRFTLDHNVIIDILNGSSNVSSLRTHIADGTYDAFVVEVGASEMRERGVRPERYDLFEALLRDAGLDELPRLPPVKIWDVTFWDHCLWGDESTSGQLDEIDQILFGESKKIPDPVEEGSADHAVWLNRKCDVLTMWCHIHHGNDVFLTSDKNFLKTTKLPRLLSLGVGRVCTPVDLVV